MSVAQTRSARRKLFQRYGDPSKRAKSIGELIERERKKAARSLNMKKK